MPKGVEHSESIDIKALSPDLIFSKMPKGVEHQMRSAIIRARDLSDFF